MEDLLISNKKYKNNIYEEEPLNRGLRQGEPKSPLPLRLRARLLIRAVTTVAHWTAEKFTEMLH